MTLKRIIFILSAFLCVSPWIDPPLALLLGLIIASTTGHPFLSLNSKATNVLLKTSIVGMGFGVNLFHALEAGRDGVVITVFSIFLTMILGWIIGRMLKVDIVTSYLISSGTAICGGSAIAAVGPIIKAKEKEMSVALGTVFILNSVALILFPFVGHYLDLSQGQFGMWSAIAIHDTSSVVGAASKYGSEALQIATTVKLERALWIIPLSLFTAFVFKSDGKKIKIPYFIFLYVVAMCIGTYVPEYKSFYEFFVYVARKGLTLTLFLIGAALSVRTIKAVGVRPLVQGVLLWGVVSVCSLLVVKMFLS
jgi:uncharacterized integral membrane protein (TIGR00698 family)